MKLKFRKKPIVIEADQFFTHGHLVDGVFLDDMKRPFVQTLEGPLHVSDGDWIITGVKGEKYPCKPDIFEATYDPAY